MASSETAGSAATGLIRLAMVLSAAAITLSVGGCQFGAKPGNATLVGQFAAKPGSTPPTTGITSGTGTFGSGGAGGTQPIQ